jgi:hypothetical protein
MIMIFPGSSDRPTPTSGPFRGRARAVALAGQQTAAGDALAASGFALAFALAVVILAAMAAPLLAAL